MLLLSPIKGNCARGVNDRDSCTLPQISAILVFTAVYLAGTLHIVHYAVVASLLIPLCPCALKPAYQLLLHCPLTFSDHATVLHYDLTSDAKAEQLKSMLINICS